VRNSKELEKSSEKSLWWAEVYGATMNYLNSLYQQVLLSISVGRCQPLASIDWGG